MRGVRTSILPAGCLVVCVILYGVAIVGIYDAGVNKSYPVKQAIEWNWRARATNNLLDMSTNLNRSLVLLEPFRGNPVWWFPTPDTDFDQIKLNIQETRNTAVVVASTEAIGSFGYQQAVQNLQETIIEINEHLDLTLWWFKWTPAAALLLGIFALLSGFGFLIAFFEGGVVGAVFGVVYTLGALVFGLIFVLVP